MMKKFLLLISSLLFLCSCRAEKDDIYSTVELRAMCQDAEFVSIKVDNSLQGNFFRNLNTGMEYDYPLFIGGRCSLKVLKGVYIFAFDGVGTCPDGSTRKVRCYSHRSPNDSVNILEDSSEIEFDLMLL